MRFYTQYWSREILPFQSGVFDHTSGGLFRTRGVKRGDVVYAVNFSRGRLRVIGRLYVDKIVNQDQAEKILGTMNLYQAIDHIIAQPGTETLHVFDAYLPEVATARIRFISPSGSQVPPARFANGDIDWQTFRSVRELTKSSADLFDRRLKRALNHPVATKRATGASVDRAIEGSATEARSKQRNARLRNQRLRMAGGVCDACGMDFSVVLGGRGTRALVVHHTRQLRDYDEPQETRLSDLAVVCANCHMIIHSDPSKQSP